MHDGFETRPETYKAIEIFHQIRLSEQQRFFFYISRT